MTETAPSNDGGSSMRGGGVKPRTIEQIENGLIVVFAMTGTIVIAPSLWWFPLAAFLVFVCRNSAASPPPERSGTTPSTPTPGPQFLA
ncbi:hypothetical protein [Jiangella alkaliphila]|uniref:hypothetical protein n=1 Tax=Jiangella alkaliphila TaxID=419479 RepID=UPI001E642034|nr:hypothetical protein [Jiangella alkaliphila]